MNFESYKIHSKRALKKMIICFSIWLIIICGPKYQQNVQEIFMQENMLNCI
jgi:hypothetical protein